MIVRHASNPYGQAVDNVGRPVHGAVGALGQAIRTIVREQPTHLLIARDGKRADSFRRDIYAEYKAHRPEADDDMSRQFALAYQGADIFSWPVLSHPRHEADDVIASAAIQFPGEVVIMTGDKDMLALCSDSVKIALLRPGHELTVGIKECFDMMGVRPHQIQDYKALVGDSSDGIPGITGIGPKSAIKLLDEYSNLENIYAHLDQGKTLNVSPAIAKKVVEGKEQAFMSWKLAGMIGDIPMDFALLVCPERPSDELHGKALESIGLRHLRTSLAGSKPQPKTTAPLDLDNLFSQMN